MKKKLLIILIASFFSLGLTNVCYSGYVSRLTDEINALRYEINQADQRIRDLQPILSQGVYGTPYQMIQITIKKMSAQIETTIQRQKIADLRRKISSIEQQREAYTNKPGMASQ